MPVLMFASAVANDLRAQTPPQVGKTISSLDDITIANGSYQLAPDFTATGTPKDENGVIGTETNPFCGTIDGQMNAIANLSQPLFDCVEDATIHDINISSATISTSGDVGAIARVARGASRIYNIGIGSGSIGGTDCVGGIVGKLDGTARVINCYSYANITDGTTVGGIVGYNNYATTQTNLRTMVMNCMMYGNITGGSDVYPVYGGVKISNMGQNVGVNNYNFYRDEANIDVKDLEHYFCSWPVEEENLTRFDYVRSALNANRELCAWWITGNVSDTALVAKWVYAPQEAKYPILKRWGRYPSVINRDIDGRSLFPRTSASPYEGAVLGRLSVTVQDANGNSMTRQQDITDMDTLHYDYGYYKIQLPYYNDVFGDPTSDDHSTRYGGNYTDKVVVGWEVTGVTGGTKGTFSTDGENGYNFADRHCTDKDIYDVSGRVFAQGGYYYVPEGVTAITIKAHWAKAYYCANYGYNRDRIDFNGSDNTSYAFTPVGTVEKTFHGYKVYEGLVNAQKAITNTGGVYDNAIVLVSNVQHRNGTSNGLYTSGKTKGFTIMSVDLDFDDEPDYVLPLQTGQNSTKPYLNPIRFDFVQVPDLGMVLKRDGDKNRLAVSCIYMTGHFEITETSSLHFNELYFGNNDKDKLLAPIIFNGGQTLEFVAGEKNNPQDRTQYIIAGGNAHMRSLYQGNHNAQKYMIKHAPMSVMGGEFDECYLSGNLRSLTTTEVWQDSPHLYTSGGRFAIIAGAGQEAVNGSVYFQIGHSIIDEFYGGSTSETGQVTGDISVQIDHSLVGKYCGGPMVGNMAAGKTITTRATGTTFRKFFGAGNGGTSFTKIEGLSADLWKLDGKSGFAHQAIDNDWKLKANYSPMRWNYKSNKSYEARYRFEIWNLPDGTSAVCAARRYVYGAQFSATKTGSVTTTLTGCTFNGDFYGGGNLGSVEGNVTSTLTDCTVNGSVFGAGYSASIPSFECYPLPPEDSAPWYPWQDTNTSICHDYKVGETKTYTWTNDGKNGDRWDDRDGDGINYVHTDSPLTGLGSVTGTVSVQLDGSTTVAGSVYGGGDEASMQGDAMVNVNGGSVSGDVYGGANVANVNGNTVVTLLGGTIYNNVYGGGKGTEDIAAEVSGDATVRLNGTDPEDTGTWVADDQKGCIVGGSVFGCNNVNGTPKGNATVHVFGTQHRDKATIASPSGIELFVPAEYATERETLGAWISKATAHGVDDDVIAAAQTVLDNEEASEDDIVEQLEILEEEIAEKERNLYDVYAVYGGGNFAAYDPAIDADSDGDGTNDYTSKEAKVIVYGCGRSVIQYVYGGGNAASAPATHVIINGGVCDYVFGGGNGFGEGNPGANVGYYTYADEAAKVAYGSGVATTEMLGGQVNHLYGGSNSKGNIRTEAHLIMDDRDGCTFAVGEAYGGGNDADIDGRINLDMQCIPGMAEIYGGAKAADVDGDIVLNITCGTFGKVFGGNNEGGNVNGSITVNINETGCTPIRIGELYGCGNKAGYSIYGYEQDADGEGQLKTDGDNPRANPTVNVISCTSIGTVYGGGYGEDAVVVGNPVVNINEVKGAFAGKADPEAAEETLIPDEIGTIGAVFGGGNAADVIGSTQVNVGTENNSARVTGNIYGGGNNAKVSGDARVNIGKKGSSAHAL